MNNARANGKQQYLELELFLFSIIIIISKMNSARENGKQQYLQWKLFLLWTELINPTLKLTVHNKNSSLEIVILKILCS